MGNHHQKETSMPKRLRIILVVIVAAGAAMAWWWTHRATVDPHRLQLSGTIEVTQVDLAFKIPGRLLERPVDEGDTVAAGQTVARLDDVDQKLQVARAEAEAASAKAFLAKLESGSRAEEVARARAQLQQAHAASQAAESRLKLATDDVARSKNLRTQDVISQQKFDELQTVYETAFNSRREAIAQVHSAKANLDLVLAGPRKEEIEQARAQAAAAEQALALARQQLADTILKAPVNGVVLSKAAEPGAFLNPGTPVITVGQLDQVWLRGYINETDLGRVRLQQPAQVTTDTYPGKEYPGKVSFISDQAEFTPKVVQTYQERVKLMYRIKISLNNPREELKAGMPADAVIQID
jgi:membrane fusion protein YbhG